MTETEQRIAIAEVCGWKWYRRLATGPWEAKPHRALYHPTIVPEYVATLQPADMTERQCNEEFIWREGMVPDYPKDLNAMYDAEGVLTLEQLVAYAETLCSLTSSEETCDLNPSLAEYNLLHATASQRAEAFLRAIGKWKE